MRIVLIALLCLLSSFPALAQKRVALVVGNSAYEHTGKLGNPRNDATDMAAALKKLGFRVVEGFDLDKAAFDRKVRDFAAALQGAEAGLFFFAGHGLQVAGHNYLVPVDAELKTASALDFEMVRLDVVQRVMEHETSTNILFLDACRDNPLARNLARAFGQRSAEVGRGFAPVVSGVGTLISFSTQPGNVALDGTGRNSPFASALVKHLVTPKDDLSAILIDVRNDVMRETENKQVPWEHSALRGRFYFVVRAPIASVGPPTAPVRLSEAAEAWGIAERANTVPALEAFIRRFGDTYYGDLAKVRLDELKQQVAVAAPPAVKPSTPKLSEPAVATAPSSRKSAPLTATEERALKPKDSFKECDECPDMAVVPAGSFTMGSPDSEPGRSTAEGPQRTVKISRPLAIGKYEVTVKQYADFVASGAGPSDGGGCHVWTAYGHRFEKDRTFKSPAFSQLPSHPVVCVSWQAARTYVNWLTVKTGHKYRLLSEAEWEYAARANTTTRYFFGENESQICEYGNGADRTSAFLWGNHLCSDGAGVQTSEVGKYRPNGFGLYDTIGNAWEWVDDCMNPSYVKAPTDGSAWMTGDCGQRVMRGGSWDNDPKALRSAARAGNNLQPKDNIGFRVARDLN